MTVVFLSDIPWAGLHQRPQHIVLALAKRWRVLWVEPTTLLKRSYVRPVRVTENVFVMTVPVIPSNHRFKAVEGIARPLGRVPLVRRLFTLVQHALLLGVLKRLEMDPKDIGFVVENFRMMDVVKKFQPGFVLFDYIDNAFGFSRMSEHAENAWQRTVEDSDMIVVTSPALERQVRRVRTGDVFCVGNGVEFKFFAGGGTRERPSDLPPGGPVVGYIGAVSRWLDYDLLRFACGSMEDVRFVFIGPVDTRVRGTVRTLSRLPNVSFLGFRNYQVLPEYLACCDACIIPFLRNELTAAVNPVKLYEYSAQGKPTVVTDFSEDLGAFGDAVSIARTKEEFVSLIRTALGLPAGEGLRARLVDFARRNDWDSKTSVIVNLIQQKLSAQRHAS